MKRERLFTPLHKRRLRHKGKVPSSDQGRDAGLFNDSIRDNRWRVLQDNNMHIVGGIGAAHPRPADKIKQTVRDALVHEKQHFADPQLRGLPRRDCSTCGRVLRPGDPCLILKSILPVKVLTFHSHACAAGYDVIETVYLPSRV